MPASADRPTPRGVLWALMFGNFVIGTGIMVVAGTLNEISASLSVSVATAGQLISAGALVVAFGAPLFATIVAGFDRRRLLAASLLWYALLHGVCTLMPSFGSLLATRVLTVVSAAIFTPQAASCLGLLVPAHERGRAITFVFLGWAVASVLGMPIGALVGGLFGWRAAFALVGVVGLISAAWVWHAMPDGVKPPALSLAAWSQTLRAPALTLCIAVTVLSAGAQFTLFSYFAPYFKTQFAATPGQISVFFAWFGAFGFIGNALMSRYIERIGAPASVMAALGSMAVSLAAWSFGSSLALTALVALPWALGLFAANSAQQARLVGIAPALASGSIALNTSAMYAGQAIGTASGGWLIAAGRFESLHWYGLAGLLAAMLVSAMATRAVRRAP